MEIQEAARIQALSRIIFLVILISYSVPFSLGLETNVAPHVWMCDNRIFYDDFTEPGRIRMYKNIFPERRENYAFEGEQISWTVLVMDENGIETIDDVFTSVQDDLEVSCRKTMLKSIVEPSCNAQIDTLDLTGTPIDSETQQYYTCTLTVPPVEQIYGEYHVDIIALDDSGLFAVLDETEFWFFNPTIAISLDGNIAFEDVVPGSRDYSQTILLSNDADEGAGVLLDVFLTGTDFYDTKSKHAKCPTSNTLALDRFSYFAEKGAYSTLQDLEEDLVDFDRYCDSEGFCSIEYGIGMHNPKPFYQNAEILQAPINSEPPGPVGYYPANVLTPHDEMKITFAIDLPDPCIGTFDQGSIYFWAEVV